MLGKVGIHMQNNVIGLSHTLYLLTEERKKRKENTNNW